TTDTIRLHRLVRLAAAAHWEGDAVEVARKILIDAIASVYPSEVYKDPTVWPRARRLDALAVDLVAGGAATPSGAEKESIYLLDRVASYRQAALAAYEAAGPLFERALAIREKTLGPDHPEIAQSLNNLAVLLKNQGDLSGARALVERALAICEKS